MPKCKNCGQEFGYVVPTGLQAAFGLCMKCEKQRIELSMAQRAFWGSFKFENPLPPVVCSQADIARFLDRSPNTAGLLEELKLKGILMYQRGERRTFRIWFSNQEQHERALILLR